MSEKKLAQEWDITIDAEFAAVNRKLSPEEQDLLEDDLESGGCRDDLVIWQHNGQRILLDGHYRYRACLTLGVPFGVIALAVASREEALTWIKDNQRARRNCTAAELSYLRGKRHEDEKGEHGGDRGNQHTKAKGHDVPLAEPELAKGQSAPLNGSTAERLAGEFGVDPKTIKRDAAFARAADTVAANAGHEALASILAGELGSKKDIQALAGLPPDEQREAVSGGKATVKAAAAQVARRAPKKKSAPPAPEPLRLDLAGVKHAFLALSEDDRMAFLDWIDHELIETTTAGYSS
ncbi:MAG TPA: hypothetical protein VF306_09130 [Pirellulales bacterium]